MDRDATTSRRGFYHRAIYGLWSLIGLAFALPAVAYLFFPSKRQRGSRWVDAGDISGLRESAPQEVAFQRVRADGWKMTVEKATAWVIKTPKQEIRAFSPICPHLGCAYHWEKTERKFVCPCHDSLFTPEGQVLTGPSPRPLDRLEVRMEGKRLWLGSVIRGKESDG